MRIVIGERNSKFFLQFAETEIRTDTVTLML